MEIVHLERVRGHGTAGRCALVKLTQHSDHLINNLVLPCSDVFSSVGVGHHAEFARVVRLVLDVRLVAARPGCLGIHLALAQCAAMVVDVLMAARLEKMTWFRPTQ